jgi:hypothetical protein
MFLTERLKSMIVTTLIEGTTLKAGTTLIIRTKKLKPNKLHYKITENGF